MTRDIENHKSNQVEFNDHGRVIYVNGDVSSEKYNDLVSLYNQQYNVLRHSDTIMTEAQDLKDEIITPVSMSDYNTLAEHYNQHAALLSSVAQQHDDTRPLRHHMLHQNRNVFWMLCAGISGALLTCSAVVILCLNKSKKCHDMGVGIAHIVKSAVVTLTPIAPALATLAIIGCLGVAAVKLQRGPFKYSAIAAAGAASGGAVATCLTLTSAAQITSVSFAALTAPAALVGAAIGALVCLCAYYLSTLYQHDTPFQIFRARDENATRCDYSRL